MKRFRSILVGLCLVATSVPVFANQMVAKNGGEVIVNPPGKISLMAANHSTPGGGDWYWGYEGGVLFSSYSHKTLYHSATVTTDLGVDKKYRHADGTFDGYAHAEMESNGKGTNKVNWNTY